MDVAKVLVEVNPMKPLPQNICFRDRDQCSTTIQVNYPWLPPRCTSCDGWGHIVKDCSKLKSLIILQWGKSLEKQSGSSATGKEVVLKLLDDLERVEVNQLNHNVDAGNNLSLVESVRSDLSKTHEEGDWSMNGRHLSPGYKEFSQPAGKVEFPNGFWFEAITGKKARLRRMRRIQCRRLGNLLVIKLRGVL